MSELCRITVNPEQCGGRPCIRGMSFLSNTQLPAALARCGKDHSKRVAIC